jgi:hypothetical protein
VVGLAEIGVLLLLLKQLLEYMLSLCYSILYHTNVHKILIFRDHDVITNMAK